MNAWVYSPQSGGNKIPEKYHWQIRQQAENFARTRSWHTTHELKLRFRSQFCYFDALKKG